MSKYTERADRINLGLAILGVLIKPGETLECTDIAAFCGCSKQNIHAIQQSALGKIKNALDDGNPHKPKHCVVCGDRVRNKKKKTCSVICGLANDRGISRSAAESLLPDYVWR